MKPIEMNLKYPGKCCECAARLPKGTRAVWHGKGKVYCLTCINGGESKKGGSWLAVTSGGEVWENRNGRCEDAPCCGCCGQSNYGGYEMSEEFDLRHEMRDDNYDY